MMNNTTCASLGLSISHPDSLTATYKTIYVAAAFLVIPLSAFTVAANATIIIALVRSHFRNPRDRFAVNVSIVKSLIISMAVSDAFIGCFSMPIAIYELFMYGHWTLGQSLCIIKQASDVFMCTVSIYHVACMAVDRYLAVCWPLTYRTLSINTGYSMIAVSWGISAALSVVPFLNDWHVAGMQDIVACYNMNRYCSIIFNLPYQTTSALISFYIPMLAICVFYYLIARKVWLVSRQFSHMAFRNSILRLRRNFYSLSIKSRENEAPLKSLGEENGTLSLQEAGSKQDNTTSHLMCTSSQYATANKTTLCENSAGAKCHLGEQTEQPRFDTVTDVLPTSHHSKSINNSTSASTTYNLSSGNAEIRDDCNSVTSYQENSNVGKATPKNYPENESTIDKSGNREVIIHSSKKSTTRPHSCHEEIASVRQQHNHMTRRTWRERDKGGSSNMKTVRTIGSVVVCFTLCWMPFSVYIVILSYHNYALPPWPYFMLTWLGYLNSALNPVLYCGNRSIRHAVSSFICQRKGTSKASF